jgi:hypothetical protein
MAKRHMKKSSTFLAIKEMQIKTTLRFHLTFVRMTTIKNTMTNVGEDVGKKKPTYIAGGNVTSITTVENSMAVSLKTKNRIAI